MSQYDTNNIYSKQAASLLAQALESAIAGLWSSITTNVIGDTATVVTDAEIRQAIEKLDSTNYPLSESAFFFHPYPYWIQIHAIAKYYNEYQSGMPMTKTGNFSSSTASENLKGTLFGIPLYTSTNVVSGLQTYRNLLLHKSAFGFAIQNRTAGKVRVQTENSIRNLGQLTVVDIIYGVAVLREEGAVLINSSSSFIGS